VPERTIVGRLPWLGSDRFVRLVPGERYTVIPDSQWPDGAFGLNRNRRLIKESALGILTGGRARPLPPPPALPPVADSKEELPDKDAKPAKPSKKTEE